MTTAHREAGLAAVAAIHPLTADSRRRLGIYVDLLTRWNAVHNLVAPSTLPDAWARHVADSAQVLAALPTARRWLDLGSGAGFPGLVTAILLADTPGPAQVDLVESVTRKAAFIATVIRETGAPAAIHTARAEDVVPRFAGRVDAVSARALAPLPRLLDLAAPALVAGAAGVFHKGRDFDAELAAVTRWHFDLVEIPSRIEPGSRITVIRGLESRV